MWGFNPCCIGLWVATPNQVFDWQGGHDVSILVVLDCGSRLFVEAKDDPLFQVSILVVLDCGSRHAAVKFAQDMLDQRVSILVVLDCGSRPSGVRIPDD